MNTLLEQTVSIEEDDKIQGLQAAFMTQKSTLLDFQSWHEATRIDQIRRVNIEDHS